MYRYADLLEDQDNSNEALRYYRSLTDSFGVISSTNPKLKDVKRVTYHKMGHLFQQMNLFDSALIYYELCYEYGQNSVFN